MTIDELHDVMVETLAVVRAGVAGEIAALREQLDATTRASEQREQELLGLLERAGAEHDARLEGVVNTTQRELAALLETVSEQSAEQATLREQVVDVAQQVAAASVTSQTGIDQLTARVARVGDWAASLEDTINQVRADAEQAQAAATSDRESAATRLSILEQRTAELPAAVAAHEESLTRLTGELLLAQQQTDTRLRTQHDFIVAVKQGVVEAKQAAAARAATEQVKAVEDVVVEWCMRLEDRAAAQEQKASALEETLLATRAKVDQVVLDVAEIPEIDIGALAEHQIQVEDNLAEIHTAIGRANSTTEALRGTVDDHVAALRAQIAAVSAAATLLSEDHATTQAQMAALPALVDARIQEVAQPIRLDIEKAFDGINDLAQQHSVRAAQRADEQKAAQAQVNALRADLEHALAERERETSEQLLALRSYLDGELTIQETAIHAASQRLDDLQTDILERYTLADAWARGGEPYKRTAIVRHRGGIWQATETTGTEPGTDTSWFLLANGVAGTTIESLDETQARLSVRLSDGTETGWTFRAPVPRFRGVYDAENTYEPWDTVAKDGRVFLALVQSPTGSPGEVLGEWQIFTGPPGKKGKPGDSGPSVDAVAQQVRAVVVEDVIEQVVPMLQEALNAR